MSNLNGAMSQPSEIAKFGVSLTENAWSIGMPVILKKKIPTYLVLASQDMCNIHVLLDETHTFSQLLELAS